VVFTPDGRWAYQFTNDQPLIKPEPMQRQISDSAANPHNIMEEIREANPQLITHLPCSLPI